MVRKEDVDFYCGFSRKELQSLCKKYNLPANRSSSDMAESLASYFEVLELMFQKKSENASYCLVVSTTDLAYWAANHVLLYLTITEK